MTDKNLADALTANEQSPPGINQNSEMAIEKFEDIVKGVISEAQFSILSGRTPPRYIKTRPGKGGKIFSYVPHGYVTAVLNKAFGFDWDFELIPIDGSNLFLYMESGKSGKKQKASVLVHGKLTVRIHDKKGNLIATITKTSTGEKEEVKNMSWGSLIKSAESDAFKKAASRLGIALDLYWQDADEDYIPAEKLTPEQQELVDAIGQIVNRNGHVPPVPTLRGILKEDGHELTMPEVATAFTLYQKQSK